MVPHKNFMNPVRKKNTNKNDWEKARVKREMLKTVKTDDLYGTYLQKDELERVVLSGTTKSERYHGFKRGLHATDLAPRGTKVK